MIENNECFLRWVTFFLVMLSLVIFYMVPLNLGIEFTGGHVMEVGLPLNEVQSTLNILRLSDGALVDLSQSALGVLIKSKGFIDSDLKQITDGFGEMLLSSDAMGASVGAEMVENSVWSLAIALCAILFYLAFRFNFWMASAAIIALFLDILISCAAIVFFQVEVTTLIVGALMTIIGYSINDSVVTLDKIREVSRGSVDSYELYRTVVPKIVKRTIVTSVSTLLVVVSLVIFGGDTLFDFATVLMIGVTSGTLSSLVVVIGLTQFLARKGSNLLSFSDAPSMEGDL